MSAFVRYLYPIHAEVGLKTGDVVRVVVDDEAPGRPVEVLDETLAPADPSTREAALQVAESMIWPSWDHGW